MTAVINAFGRLTAVLIAVSSASWAVSFLSNLDEGVALNNVANAVLSGSGFKRNSVSEAALSAAELANSAIHAKSERLRSSACASMRPPSTLPTCGLPISA